MIGNVYTGVMEKQNVSIICDGQSSFSHQSSLQSFNWQSFRNQAAKDILCAIIASPSIIKLKDDKGNLIEFHKENACEVTIQYADELIKQLKERK